MHVAAFARDQAGNGPRVSRCATVGVSWFIGEVDPEQFSPVTIRDDLFERGPDVDARRNWKLASGRHDIGRRHTREMFAKRPLERRAAEIDRTKKPTIACELRVQWRPSGNANTNIALPGAIFFSGVSSAGIVVTHWPPPVPAGTARYWRPATAYVIGKPCTDVGSLV
jgi:hypothetical protein